MPNYKKHLVGGILAYCTLLYIVLFILKIYIKNPGYFYSYHIKPIEWLLSCLVGSLFPDIDIKSKFQKYFYRIILITIIYLYIYNIYYKAYFIDILSLLGITICLPLVVNHRTIFHKTWFIILLLIVIGIALNYYCPKYLPNFTLNALFFLVGTISHIWLDLGFKKIFKI